MKTYINSIALLLFSATGYASSNIEVRDVRFTGSGCHQDQVRMDVSDDNKALTALFSEYVVQAGGSDPRRVNIKDCKITFRVKLADGYRLAVSSVEHAGYADIPIGAKAIITSEFFIPGKERLKIEKTINTPMADDFILAEDGDLTKWSNCGGEEVFQILTRAVVTTNSAKDPTIVAIDSTDSEAGLTYNLDVEACGGNPYPNPDPTPDPDETLDLIAYLSLQNYDLFTTTKQVPPSYQYEYSLGKIWAHPAPGRRPLLACEGVNDEGYIDMYSNLSCGSDRVLGIIGNIEVQPASGGLALYSCISHYGNRFLADSSRCNDNSPRRGRFIGYSKR